MSNLRRALVLSLVLGAGLALAPSAFACGDGYTTPAFAPWGDGTQYDQIPGGSFEGASAWTLTGGAGPVSGGNPSASAPSAQAMSLGTGDTITSPSICLDQYDLYLRFVARASGGHSTLKTSILWTDANGAPKVTQLDDIDGKAYSAWGLSPALKYKDAQPAAGAPQRTVRIQFSVQGKGARWALDDVSDGVAPAAACPLAPTADAFSPWGDGGNYAEVPGGSFDGSLDWTTVGSPTLVSDGNPRPYAATGLSAVRLGSGDSITSQMFCIDRDHPVMRYVRRVMTGGAHLRLSVLWTDPNGNAKATDLDDANPSAARGGWGLSQAVGFKDALPQTDTARHVRVRFAVDGKGGAWVLDDVYVDPLKRG